LLAQRLKNNYISRKFKRISVNVLIFFAKIVIFLRKLVTGFLVFAIYRPALILLRFIFYKFIVKIYKFYLWLIRKAGWAGFRVNFFSFLFDQKLVHIAVAAITVVIIGANLTADSRAQAAADDNNKNILSGLIESEFGTPEEEQLIEEFFDKEAVISPTQQNYLENLSAVKSQPAVELNPEELAEDPAELNPDEIGMVRPDPSTLNRTTIVRRETISYAVEAGDTVSTIAEKFGISVNTILWENSLSAYSLIRPGDSLSILPTTGVVHKVTSGDTITKVASKYSIDEETIKEFNSLAEDAKLAIGQKLMIPGGRKESYASYQPSSYSGLSIIKDLVSPIKKGVDSVKKLSGNKMFWPTVGKRITQYFSWRHFAVDIANKTGTPIYAADAGEIEVAGWGRGYGNQVVVDHGGGKKTRYGHMSKILVRPGQDVDKGQKIGLMGSTGWSTGPHLHFEVIINGGKYNPLNYIR